MGKKSKSGKKAWRANISTDDIQDFFDNSTKDALSGGSLSELPSDSLFYLDKSTDLSVKRKIEKHREKVLRCDSLLQRNAFVEPVPSSTAKKSKKKTKTVEKAQQGQKDLSGGMVDIWDDKVERNRRARRKEQLKAEAEAMKAEQLTKEIDSLPDIIQEIEKVEEEKQKRHLRRVTAKKEKLKFCPPRLGKRKFEPAPAQVMLSEEITGSLHKLKGCCTLARDRFKSLEKRGLVIPSKKSCRR